MWEFLVKVNPDLIRFCDINSEKREQMLAKTLEKGYLPSSKILSANPSISRNINDTELKKKIIEKDPRSIVFFDDYEPKFNELYELAIEKGYQPTANDVKKNYNLSSNEEIIKYLINQNPDNITCYSGRNPAIVSYALAKGYKPKISDVKETQFLKENEKVIKMLIEENPRNVIYYEGYKKEVIDFALYKGYIPKLSDVKETNSNYSLTSNDKIIEMLIEQDPHNVIYYTGNNTALLDYALEKGYKPRLSDVEISSNILQNNFIIETLIDKDPRVIVNYTKGNTKFIDLAIEKGYKPKLEDLVFNNFLASNDRIIKQLVENDPASIVYYRGTNEEIINYAISKGYKPKLEDFELNDKFMENETIIKQLIEQNPTNVIYYRGSNEEIIDFAISKGYKPTIIEVRRNRLLSKNTDLMIKLIEENPKNIVYYKGDNENIFHYAFTKGYKPTIDDLSNNNNLLNSVTIMTAMVKEDINNANLFRVRNEKICKGLIECVKEEYGIEIPDKYSELIYIYKNNLTDFLINYNKFSKFLSEFNITEEEFIQNAFTKKQDWLNQMVEIVNNGKVSEFSKVKDYFQTNYYKTEEADINQNIASFLNILENYNKFPELCTDIAEKNRELTPEEIKNIDLAFRIPKNNYGEMTPTKIEDLQDMVSKVKKYYEDKLKTSEPLSIAELKETLCNLVFNDNMISIESKLSIYGNTETLRLLAFNNRNNHELEESIKKMMVYTSLMETVINMSNLDKGKVENLTGRVIDNFEQVIKLSSNFSDYEEKMRIIYEMDIHQNLTNFSNIENKESVIDKEKSEKYGVEVIDYSNKKYCVLAHVMSKTEKPEELINGVTNGKGFISLSPISNRNQVYYTNPDESKIIFATDIMPEGAFIQSGVENLGSNGAIDKDAQVKEMSREQRGIIETSQAIYGNNSEVLAYRQGMKFKYIVLPDGREPTEIELQLAKEQGLKFIATQKYREMIEEPEEIKMVPKEEREKEQASQEKNLTTEQRLETMFSITPAKKQIAILADAHGLFEPTLAVLEDARRTGITEIYSLGDNIGTGPNPSEVMNLLDEYGVVSIAGNHEMYVSLGVEEFKEHLENAGPHSYSEAERVSNWTRNQLSKEQLEQINLYDKAIELVLGGKKLILCHDIKDYNNGTMLINPNDYHEVIRGHEHFGKTVGNVTTLPGVGIGNNAGFATYMILTENEKGGYSKEIKTIPYNKDNLKYGISESTLSVDDKNKIERWAGVESGTARR